MPVSQAVHKKDKVLKEFKSASARNKQRCKSKTTVYAGVANITAIFPESSHHCFLDVFSVLPKTALWPFLQPSRRVLEGSVDRGSVDRCGTQS